jgi:hypothetical protein
MKKLLFNLGIILFAAATMASCGGDVTCDVKNITAVAKGEQGKLLIEGTDGPCKVIYAPEWMSVNVDENVIRYYVTPNNTKVGRESCLVVACAKKTFYFPIKQACKSPYLILSEKKVEMGSEGDTVRIAVITDGGKVSVKSMPEVMATIDGDYLTLISQKNEASKRVGTVKVTSGKLTRSLSVVINGIEEE